ncbi:mucin-16-like [Mobula hypostoma]|uniref:mucin-16-like n=1 Tax=Mobula hypostoma TaxID=723540 RepID=UPI002FC282E5
MENESTQEHTPISDRSAHQQKASSSSPTIMAAVTTPTRSPERIVTENVRTQEEIPACQLPGYQHGASSPTTAAVAAEEAGSVPYNISFIVNKLTFEEVKSDPAKPATKIAAELTDLFMNSNIKATFTKCTMNIFRELMNDSTGVTVNCLFKNESEAQGINEEHVYDILKEETRNSSRFGPYELEKLSLYVNGYTELPTAIVPVETNPIVYYVSFNVKKPNFEEIQSNPSVQAKVITTELTDLFLNSHINATFLKCVVHSFREVMDDSTRVTANCSFKNETDIEGVIIEHVYQVFEKNTNDVSILEIYELEKHSLYVSDNMESPTAIAPVEETNPIMHYVSFIVKKPNFEEIQSNLSEQAKVITTELTDLFLNSRINATFLKCVVHSLRLVRDDSTRVTANCSFKNETDIEGVISQQVYDVFEKNTNDMSTLGTYELEKDSLYVSDNMEFPTTIAPVEETNPIMYYVSFIVKKPNFEEIQSNLSEQAKVIATELTDLFLNSRINATFLKCVVHSFREVIDDSTRVTANCSFKNETDIEGVISQQVYDVFEKNTNDMSTLGTYELEKDSLYVSDNMEFPNAIAPVEETNPIMHYVSFIVKKPNFEEIQSNLSEQAKVITTELTDLFLNSRINATFLKCVVHSLRLVRDDSTRVTANCSFKNETDIEGVISQQVYDVFEKNTNDMSTLGTYELEKDSLYVSDNMEFPTTIAPVEETNPIMYYVSFIVKKPNFEEIQSNLSEQAKVIATELTDLFLNSRINATFLKCVVHSFREVIDDSTRVTANCSFKNETDIEGVISQQVYDVFEKNTNDMSTLGTYELEKDSLYVSDNMEFPTTIAPVEETNPIMYYVSFIVKKPNFEEIQSNLSEQAKVIATELTDLFLNSRINATFLKCVVHSFREVIDDSTRVTANCSFKNETDIEGVISQQVYDVFEKNTNDMSTLGTYELEKDSLYVSDNMEFPNAIAPVEETNPIMHYVSFIVKKPNFEEIQSNLSEQAKVITTELTDLFLNSRINATFLKCVVHSLRLVRDDSTRVTANCSFKNETDIEGVISQQVYDVFEKNTNDMSTLGTYELEKDSLYVSDNMEFPTTIAPVEETNPIMYYVSFIVKKPNFEEIQSNLSEQAKVIATELTDLFLNSRINATFLKCVVHSFREVIDDSTRVTANCSFKNETDIEGVISQQVYDVFEKNTNDMSTLGTYELEKDSLYVSDNMEFPTAIAPVEETNPIMHYVSFIVKKPNFEEIQTNLSEQAKVITTELTDLFLNSRINATFLKCVVHSFRLVRDDSTRVTANCSFKNETDIEGVISQQVYDVFEKNTNDMSTLGTYELEKDSLYVSDNMEFPTTIAPVEETNPIMYYVSFIVKKPNFEEIQSNLSEQAKVIATELTDLFLNSSINATFLKCVVHSFWEVMDDSTRVTANCSFKNESDTAGVNRERVYEEFARKTSNVSVLGSYELEKNSLSVNGYMELSSPTSTVPDKHTYPIYYNVTFVVNKLTLEQVESNKTEKASMIAAELTDLFKDSKINTTFIECAVESFRKVMDDSTRVTANCSFKNESLMEGIDRERVYDIFKEETSNMSTFGSYDLEKHSLYVNGYREIPSHITPDEPNQSRSQIRFNVTFTITNLPYMEGLHNQESHLYQSASQIVTKQLTASFEKSKINTTFIACNTMSLSATSDYKTKVYAICSFNETSDEENVDRVIVYHQFRYKTKNLTALGPYSVDKYSLFVNDYHESAYPTKEPPIVPETQHPSLSQTPLCFNVSSIATKLPYSSVLLDPTSQVHQSASFNCIQQLNGILRNSSISAAFLGCTNVSFSNANKGLVKVLATCLFKKDVQEVDNVIVDQVFRDATSNTSNTIYGFLMDNLQVTGCKEPEVPTTVATPSQEVSPTEAERQGDLTFEVNFTIINVNFTDNLFNSSSSEYINLSNGITKKMSALFRESSLKKSHKFCRVTELSPGPDSPGSVNVFTTCFFDPVKETESITENRIRSDFETGTNNVTWLGQYQLKPRSLSVAAASPVTTDKVELPYWAIIVIVLGILLALLLVMILGCLIALCIKKKFHGFYNLLQNPFGIYYSHLDGKK